MKFFCACLFLIALTGCTLQPTGLYVYIDRGSDFSVDINGNVKIQFESPGAPGLNNTTYLPDAVVRNIIWNQTGYKTPISSAQDTTIIASIQQSPPDQNAYLWFSETPDQLNNSISEYKADQSAISSYIDGVKSGSGSEYGFLAVNPPGANMIGNMFSPGLNNCVEQQNESHLPVFNLFVSVVPMSLNQAFLDLKSGTCDSFFGSTASLHALYNALASAGYNVIFGTEPDQWLTSAQYQQGVGAP